MRMELSKILKSGSHCIRIKLIQREEHRNEWRENTEKVQVQYSQTFQNSEMLGIVNLENMVSCQKDEKKKEKEKGWLGE